MTFVPQALSRPTLRHSPSLWWELPFILGHLSSNATRQTPSSAGRHARHSFLLGFDTPSGTCPILLSSRAALDLYW